MRIIDQNKFKDFHTDKFKDLILSKVTNLDHEIIFFEEKRKTENFLIFENDRLLAAVPLFFEESLNGNELLGSYYNLSIPGPIILEDLSDKKFKKIIKIIIDEIEIRSKKKNLKKIKINFSDTINNVIGSQKYFILNDYLSNLNFLNVSFIGLRIDLRNDINEISKNFSKGHKSELKKQLNQKYFFYNYEKKKLTYAQFYHLVKDQIDLENYCEPLYEIFKKNKIYLVYSLTGKEENFCSLFSITGNTVEYFVDTISSINHHSLIFSSCNFFKKVKYIKYLNLGIINYGNNAKLKQSEKKKNIALFKKGFGGEKFQYTFFEKVF